MTKYRHKRIVASLFTPYVGLILTTIILILFSAIQTDWTPTNEPINFSENWTLYDGTPADLSEINDDISFHNTLPEINDSNKMLYFRAKNIIVSVYIDGQLIKDYAEIEMHPSLYYKAPGKYFVQIPLQPDYSGKNIEIKVISPYKNDSSCNIKDIQIGDANTIIKTELTEKLFSASVCLILICTGVVFVILAKALRNYNKENNNLLYLGTFTIVVGVWALTETALLQLLSDNSTFWHLITGLTLPLTITPLFLFFKRRYANTTMLPVIITNATTIIFYVIILALHFLQVADIHETITLSHIIILMGAGYTCYYAIRIFIASKYKDISFWGMIIITVFAVTDMILYKFQITNDNSAFTRIGLIAYIWFLGIEIIRDYIKTYNLYLKTELLAKAAYYDVLTDFYNRTSFIEDTKKINNEKAYGVMIAIFDMNNLKYINDIHGHINGDNAIIESANRIKNEFGPFGKCYRIGGDEFVFLSNKPMSTDDMLTHIENLESTLNHRNENLPEQTPWPLILATGYAIFDESYGTFTNAFDVADKMMYDRKQKLKMLHPEMNMRI